MGIAIPQVVTEDRASGAQVIDGSLKFDSNKSTNLSKTLSSSGNRKTWTWSGWLKPSDFNDDDPQIFTSYTDANNRSGIFLDSSEGYKLSYYSRVSGTSQADIETNAVIRDFSSFYHFVISVDTTQSTSSDRIKIYINGNLQTLNVATYPSQNYDTYTNVGSVAHYIGKYAGSPNYYGDGLMSQVYFIDGLALGPEYFGFTDGLTNTWRPKKYEGTYGTNGFYLPMDGNSLIGQDKSGQGNDWTPVNFGGSVALDNPEVSGARPTLNTDGGGKTARPGVFGSEVSKYYTVTTANGSVYQFDITSGDNPSLSFIRGATYTFDYDSYSSHPLRFSSTNPDSSTTAYTDGTSVSGNVIKFTVPHNAPDTLYYYCTAHPTAMNGSISVTTDETKADPYAWKCILSIPLIGSTNDVSGNVNCTTSSKTVSTTGSVSASSVESNFYGGSHRWEGNDDYLSVPTTGFDFGTDDFTVEEWVYIIDWDATYNARMMFDMRPISTNGAYLAHGFNTTGVTANTNTDTNYPGTFTVDGWSPLGRWMHCAVCRESGELTVFVDGKSIGTKTATTNITAGSVNIGHNAFASIIDMNGYISDFRVYKGVAKYSSDFVVPSTKPDILPDTPSGVSGDSKLTKITDGAVSFDGSGDYLTCNSSDFAFGTGDFTVEAYVYLDSLINYRAVATTRPDNGGYSDAWHVGIDGNGLIALYSNEYDLSAPNGSIAPKKWSHVVVTRDSSTARIFVDGKLVVSGSVTKNYTRTILGIGDFPTTQVEPMLGQISNLRIIKGSVPTEYQTSSTTAGTQIFTPPTAPLTNVTNTKLLCCQSNTSATAAAVAPGSITNPSSGYSFNTAKIYSVYNGGTRSANFTVEYSDDNSNWTTAFTGTMTTSGCGVVSGSGGGGDYGKHNYWRYTNNEGTGSHHPRMSRLILSDGTTDVTIQTFTSDNCSDSGTIPGNGTSYTYTDTTYVQNNASATNFNPFNTDINTVHGQESGYATLNPLDSPTNLFGTISDGNLQIIGSTNAYHSLRATIYYPTTGKWYYESTLFGTHYSPRSFDSQYSGVGFVKTGFTNLGITDGNSNWLGDNGYGVNFSGTRTDLYGANITAGSVIGVAVDRDANTYEYFVNGVSTSTGTIGVASGTELAAFAFVYGSSYTYRSLNFGQKPFKFSPPEGFQPLNSSTVRPSTVIARPDQYVGVATYTGSSGNVVVDDLNFKPDVVWIKQRNASGYTDDHVLVDSVRGRSKSLYPSATYSENTSDADKDLISFDINGFTLGPTQQSAVNRGSSGNYVAWCWKAGGNKGVFNVDDVGYASAAAAGLGASGNSWDSDPTGASIGTKQGFSIIKHTGTGSTGTLPHGLTQKPTFYISKPVSTTGNWVVYFDFIDGSLDYLYLNGPDARGNSSQSVPTSELFSYGYTANEYIHYLWHDVPGLQKFGTYEGNNSTDGPFIELGFRPAIIIFKNIDSSSPNWEIYDFTERDKINPYGKVLSPNSAIAENDVSASYPADALSNGIKIRHNGAAVNAANTYIYAAWAEAPSFNLYGGQSNAR